ncbi:MAG: thiamine phosphate synthase [Polaromonas sp.]|uniref:thiamine phosphate synthase n=1 Tax=Polaromonas sp. TaxID=1869339 RepID=UPI0017B71F89|nr:thiamine phosphate synthase [Polaromonas sp.]MBA3593475.1 thiamine phosphate synthase [Polaromonas sp.]
MTSPVNTAPVWALSTHAKELNQLLQGQSAQPGPRAALLCIDHKEAAALLGLDSLDTRDAVEQAASTLRTRVCKAVVIIGSKNENYADTPQAIGRLSLPAGHLAVDSSAFAASAADALAKGFVAIDAIILASMATANAQPGTAFSRHSGNLPYFSLPQPTPVSGFAPLSDPDLGVYAVVDSAAWVERVVIAGVRTVQLRIKDAQQPEQREFVRQQVRRAIAAATTAGAQLFINDHWQLAIEEGAYGVHLGQEDLHIADLDAIQKAGLRLGISTHAYWEVCRAWALQPSYIACGPIHPTQAKVMPWIPQGNDNLAYWCALLPTPVVGIAGMDVPRTEQAARAGAAGVAVISAITAAPSPEAAIVQLQEAMQRGRKSLPITAPLFPKPTLLPTP